MIEVSCSIDEAALGRLESLLNGIAEAAPQKLASETRHAAIYICQSLRARTKSAPKRIPRREYEATVSAVPPKYVHSNSAHHRLLRRWTLARKIGTPDAYAKHYYVYTDRHRAKGGKMAGGSLAAERRELLKEHGGIQHYGLAKKSWGWTMKQIYSGTVAGDLSWKHGKHDRRDPRQSVRGVFQKAAGGAFAEITNRLDYILAAVPPSAIDEAIAAATKRMEHNVESLFMERNVGSGNMAFWRRYAKAKGREFRW